MMSCGKLQEKIILKVLEILRNCFGTLDYIETFVEKVDDEHFIKPIMEIVMKYNVKYFDADDGQLIELSMMVF